ncbi:MAG: hypothetical protein ACD_80C00011G0002 [uncultured bacterium (gcode 4)]|uniref:Uncharacterized protein n=1 Tax=uncultured bacterium (gcode 4) TaxID=1234023 RepID=K1X5W0_9BACT|nr:MAG: hypothetical protein ACD_80C00011G0002 [uncultured bacterium (gcode 4)]
MTKRLISKTKFAKNHKYNIIRYKGNSIYLTNILVHDKRIPPMNRRKWMFGPKN